MGMIKWVKPSGVTIETNDTEYSVREAHALGWKRIDDAKPEQKPAEKPAKKGK